ncbi:hypothetical protein KZJ38_18355 [Paraburkholderia edwinii]|jgi:hypothetical protein|uniref:Uncharacterized protein n=1 Tax=Paraburkholderia edwinii TaxID=2861782 RepID=A0ABX8UIN7_9BURK|nr:hypothetical protein [Paraburkholderia edwinii]QYD68212.1 hypothetical protein KZJ38_18355 [Paraburkholderia edwinii]
MGGAINITDGAKQQAWRNRIQVVSMVGIPGSSPKTRGQTIIGVIVFIAIMGFVVYVVVKSVFFS